MATDLGGNNLSKVIEGVKFRDGVEIKVNHKADKSKSVA